MLPRNDEFGTIYEQCRAWNMKVDPDKTPLENVLDFILDRWNQYMDYRNQLAIIYNRCLSLGMFVESGKTSTEQVVDFIEKSVQQPLPGHQAPLRIDEQLAQWIEEHRHVTHLSISGHVEDMLAHMESVVDLELRKHNKKRCGKCNGYGKIERLDSGYMKRFGMREWDGCSDCGGDHEKSGRGFV